MSLRFPTVCSGTLTLAFAVTAISGFSIVDKATTFDQVTLQNQLVQIASEARGKVGIAAMVLETGDTVSLNPRGHFPMQSVYKLPIGMAVMKQVDGGKVKLDQRVQVTTDNYVARD